MDTTPPILFDPSFLPDADGLFKHLLNNITWDERMKARRTASFGVPYDYSQMHDPACPMPPEIRAVAQRVSQRLGFEPNNCLLNHYANGHASMGFHSDSAAELAPGTGVAIVSLGSERELVFRLKADRRCEHRQALLPGSLLWMSSEMQADWLHAIPKAEGAGPRISLTFRSLVGWG